MVPLIAVLTLQIRYYAPYHVEDIDIAAPASAVPLATSPQPVTIAPPQLSAARPVGARPIPVEARPLRPSPGRAPPIVAI